MIAMTRRLAWLSIGLLIAYPFALAQVTTGTISGVVRDSTGAVIPGVSVIIKNLDLPRVSEQFHLQFRAEIFNILNRANFAVPPQTNLDLYDSNGNIIGNVGRLTTTSTSSRQIQFGLKFLW